MVSRSRAVRLNILKTRSDALLQYDEPEAPCLRLEAYDLIAASMMRSFSSVAACLALFLIPCTTGSNLSSPLSSHQILPDNFKPPQVFKNVNLVRHTNLERGYIRSTVNVVIENIDSKPQDEYYLPFNAESIGNVGGLEVRDKKDPQKPAFRSEIVEYDPYR